MLRIIIYEDKDILRESLKLMLDGMADIEVVAAFSNCNTVEQDIKQMKPDGTHVFFWCGVEAFQKCAAEYYI